MGDKGYSGLWGIGVVMALVGLLVVPVVSAEVRFDVQHVDGADVGVAGSTDGVLYAKAQADVWMGDAYEEYGLWFCDYTSESEAAAGPMAGYLPNVEFHAWARGTHMDNDEDHVTFPFTAQAQAGPKSGTVHGLGTEVYAEGESESEGAGIDAMAFADDGDTCER